MPEKTIYVCDRCQSGKFYGKNFDETLGLTDDGPTGFAARMIYSEKDKKGEWDGPETLILCRKCLESVLPILLGK